MLRSLPIAWRITLLVLLGAGLVLGVVSVVSYTSARDLLEREKQAEFAAVSEATANRIDVVGRSVEKVAAGSRGDGRRHRARARRGRATLLRSTVRANDELYAAGIGYEPRLYDNFAPYAYEPGGQYGDASAGDEESSARIVVTDLGRDGRAYEVERLVPAPRTRCAGAVWTEPYYEEGGGEVVLRHLRRPRAPPRRPGAGLGRRHRRRLAVLAARACCRTSTSASPATRSSSARPARSSPTRTRRSS